MAVGAGAPAVPRPRLVGVDVARALALLGMMSVHVLPELDADDRVTWPFLVSAGRASALFALLAGVGLALADGGERPRVRPYRPVVAAVLTRAALVASLGLLLGELSPPVAVILANYGLLFVVGLVALRLRARTLLATAAVWVVAAPLVSHALRRDLPAGPGAQPSLTLLGSPVTLLRQLLLTGYYPVLPWAAYVLVGVAVGRMALSATAVAARLLAVGAALAVAARVASDQLLRHGGLAALRAGGDEVPGGPLGTAVPQLQELGRYGTPPATSWWWQAVATPHTATPFDLAATIGSALAVVGACLLLVRALDAGPRLLRGPALVLAAAGSMTLTVYTFHVLALAAGVGPRSRTSLLLVHVVVALVAAGCVRAAGLRGPLETGVSSAATSVRDAVAGRSPAQSGK